MTSPTQLADLTSPEVAVDAASRVLAIPLGSTEQHGPHLPLSTDTDLAVALCDRLARVRAEVIVAPAIPYGASGEHAGFAGTLSIGHEALELLLVELVRSATDTFGHVIVVSGHGGNAASLSAALRRLRAESRDVIGFSPRWDGDAHAGHSETSIMLALAPGRVRTDRLATGETRPIEQLLPRLRRDGVRAVSPTGVLGDPTAASAVAGKQLIAGIETDLLAAYDAWRSRALVASR